MRHKRKIFNTTQNDQSNDCIKCSCKLVLSFSVLYGTKCYIDGHKIQVQQCVWWMALKAILAPSETHFSRHIAKNERIYIPSDDL